jgi:beta-phosphoglucomutase
MEMLGAIFDMDGVLVDSYRAHFESWKRLAAAHGVQITEEQFASTFGQTNRQIIPRFWGVSGQEADRWGDRKEQYYRELLQTDFPEMDGAGDLIAALAAAGFRLAVGSSGPPENVEVVMRCLPNARLFTATVSGAEVQHGKPDPEVFLLAARKLGVRPSCCAVIEDSLSGLDAARRAGMTAIAITGTTPREKLEAAADLVVDSLRRLSPGRIKSLILDKAKG